MKTPFDLPLNPPDNNPFTAGQPCPLLAQKEDDFNRIIEQQAIAIRQRDNLIRLLEEQLRLARIQRFAATSEKHAVQFDLFDEAELAAAIDELADQIDPDTEDDSKQPRANKRQRGFSDKLKRIRIELPLSDDEKAGAQRTFFTKVKEELQFIPAKMNVLEYWQEKAVFVDINQTPAKETLIAAPRPMHPLGKCHASVSLLTHILISKYADGLPLYGWKASSNVIRVT